MCECASVCVDILGCVICCVKTQLQATSESFMCVSSLASRPDTDLTMFSKQSQHTDFFMLYFGFCSLWIVFFLALALVLGFCFHIRSQYFFLQHTSHFNLLSLDSIFFRLLCAPIFCSSDYCVTIQKGSNDLTSHLSFTYFLFGLCGAIAISMHAFSIRNNEMVKICSHFLGKPKALIADNVLLRLFRPFL